MIPDDRLLHNDRASCWEYADCASTSPDFGPVQNETSIFLHDNAGEGGLPVMVGGQGYLAFIQLHNTSFDIDTCIHSWISLEIHVVLLFNGLETSIHDLVSVVVLAHIHHF